ncbi:MAG TPA: STAS domain-containing protein [Mycobacteriales bacterium]|nr:STAS domain-containing protein [Mycobacteriales bacterium]
MSVDIDLDQDRRVALLIVRGDITSANAPAVSGAIAGLVSRDGYDVVVDLSESGTILAGGVRALRRGCAMAHEHHRDLRVACPPSSAIRPALVLAHLDEEMPVYDSRDDALLPSQRVV